MFRDPRAAPDGQDALEAALDLERHAPRALALGLFLAALLHATCIAYGKLMPPEPRPKLFPIVVKPIEVELAPAAAPPVVVPYEIEETTIEVPVPRAPASARPAPPPSPPPPPPAATSTGTPMAALAVVPEPPPTVTAIATFLPPPPPRPTGPDRSSPARLGGNVTWKCPFPKEADPEMLHVVVRAQAEIRADGTASAVTILSDPGYGFGRAARLCALSQTFVPARGHDGQPTDGPSLPFSVHFDKY